MTALAQVALVATVILAGTFAAARGLREGWRAVETYRRECAEIDAADAWDAVVTDAQLVVAYGRHPASQRRSVAEFWRSHFPRDQTPLVLRLVKEDQ